MATIPRVVDVNKGILISSLPSSGMKDFIKALLAAQNLIPVSTRAYSTGVSTCEVILLFGDVSDEYIKECIEKLLASGSAILKDAFVRNIVVPPGTPSSEDQSMSKNDTSSVSFASNEPGVASADRARSPFLANSTNETPPSIDNQMHADRAGLAPSTVPAATSHNEKPTKEAADEIIHKLHALAYGIRPAQATDKNAHGSPTNCGGVEDFSNVGREVSKYYPMADSCIDPLEEAWKSRIANTGTPEGWIGSEVNQGSETIYRKSTACSWMINSGYEASLTALGSASPNPAPPVCITEPPPTPHATRPAPPLHTIITQPDPAPVPAGENPMSEEIFPPSAPTASVNVMAPVTHSLAYYRSKIESLWGLDPLNRFFSNGLEAPMPSERNLDFLAQLCLLASLSVSFDEAHTTTVVVVNILKEKRLRKSHLEGALSIIRKRRAAEKAMQKTKM